MCMYYIYLVFHLLPTLHYNFVYYWYSALCFLKSAESWFILGNCLYPINCYFNNTDVFDNNNTMLLIRFCVIFEIHERFYNFKLRLTNEYKSNRSLPMFKFTKHNMYQCSNLTKKIKYFKIRIKNKKVGTHDVNRELEGRQCYIFLLWNPMSQ